MHRTFDYVLHFVHSAPHTNDAPHTKKHAVTFRVINLHLLFCVCLRREDIMIKLNTKFIISTIGVVIFALVYDMFVKGHVTGDVAGSITTSVIITKVLLAGMLVHIFGLKYENKGIHEGLRFGVIIGLLLGFVSLQGVKDLGDTDLIVKLLLDGILFGVGTGVVLSVLHKDSK